MTQQQQALLCGHFLLFRNLVLAVVTQGLLLVVRVGIAITRLCLLRRSKTLLSSSFMFTEFDIKLLNQD